MNNIKILTVAVTLVGAVVLSKGTWILAHSLAGKKPVVAQNAPKPLEPFADELLELKKQVESAPDDATLLKRYAAMLETAAGHSGKLEYVIELEQIYRSIIRVNPNNALREKERLADIRFSMKDFEQAETLYRDVLATEPGNQKVRGRLASTLTFIGNFDAAIEELQIVIAATPDSFQGHAYLAITYAQMGDTQKALEVGQTALTLAPSDEAKSRFTNFLNSLTPQATTSESAPKAVITKKSLESNAAPSAVIEYLTKNDITSSKFVSSTRKEDTLILRFKNFPIAAMPPFAKEKFFSNLKNYSKDSAIKIIRLLDAENDEELATITIED